jgi:hypothetical protein
MWSGGAGGGTEKEKTEMVWTRCEGGVGECADIGSGAAGGSETSAGEAEEDMEGAYSGGYGRSGLGGGDNSG